MEHRLGLPRAPALIIGTIALAATSTASRLLTALLAAVILTGCHRPLPRPGKPTAPRAWIHLGHRVSPEVSQ
jgi:hypothetical protein